MALPAGITEGYLHTCHNDLKQFWGIVERRVPKGVQARVSEFTSQVSDTKCIFRDRDGVVLFETPDPPPPVEEQSKYYVPRPAPDTKAQQSQAMTRKLALANSEAVVAMSEALGDLANRVKELEQQLSAATDRIDMERRGITFRGPWQVAIDYEPGAIVTYSERTYVASKAIRCGGQPPARQGSGWLHMFDSTEVPR